MENKIFIINPLADVEISPFKYSWNEFIAPSFLQDFLEQKGVDSKVINLNELFIKTFYSNFYLQNRQKLKKRLLNFENKQNLSSSDLRDYFDSKFLDFYLDTIKEDNLLASVDNNVLNLPKLSFLFMKHIDVFQGKTIVANPTSSRILKNIPFFEEVMKAALNGINFDDSLVVFSVPTKMHMNTIVQTAKLIKKIFSNVTILVGGSYINLMKHTSLDNLVVSKIIDIYIDDSSEGKLLHLSKKFKDGSLGTFRGCYLDEDKITINDLIRTKIINPSEESLLLSKGCYWSKCRYCEFPVVCGKFTIKNTDVILDELENFYNKGVTNFHLITDCIPPIYAQRVAKGIIERGLKINWDTIYMRIDNGFTEDVLTTMKESGFDFSQVIVGLESAFDGALEKANKGYTSDEIVLFFERIRKLGIVFRHVNIIIDLPGTTFEGALFVKNFCLDIMDLTDGIFAGKMYLSSDSEFGKNSNQYGIQIEGEIDHFCQDSLGFTINNDLTFDEKEMLLRFYDYLRFLKGASLNYSIPRFQLAKNFFYNENKLKLTVKFPKAIETMSLNFDDLGNSTIQSILIPKKMKSLIPESLFIIRNENLFDKNKYYSINEMADILSASLNLNKLLLRQKLFYTVIALLDNNYFDDVKVEIY